MAQLCLAITLLLSPHAIVISGGLLQRECLFPMIRKEFTRLLNGYVPGHFSHTKMPTISAQYKLRTSHMRVS